MNKNEYRNVFSIPNMSFEHSNVFADLANTNHFAHFIILMIIIFYKIGIFERSHRFAKNLTR